MFYGGRWQYQTHQHNKMSIYAKRQRSHLVLCFHLSINSGPLLGTRAYLAPPRQVIGLNPRLSFISFYCVSPNVCQLFTISFPLPLTSPSLPLFCYTKALTKEKPAVRSTFTESNKRYSYCIQKYI